MNQPIHPLLQKMDHIESIRDQLIKKLEVLSVDVLNKKPSPETWNILEIVEHLVLAERAVLGKPGASQKTYKQTMKHRLVYFLVIGILKSFIKVKVPVKSMNPAAGKTLAELETEWKKNHRMLRLYIQREIDGKISGTKFKHPVSGPLTTSQALTMMEVHLNRHIKQINALLS